MIVHERPLVVLTGRLGCADEDAVNVTGSVFAPSWGVEQQAPADQAAWTLYKARYTAEMRQSYVQHPEAWQALLARSRAVLCCACQNVDRCHRTLLAGMLVKCGAVYLGEWQPGTPWLDLGPAEGRAC